MAGSYESHVPAHRSLGRIARIGLACVFSAFCVLIKDFTALFTALLNIKYLSTIQDLSTSLGDK